MQYIISMIKLKISSITDSEHHCMTGVLQVGGCTVPLLLKLAMLVRIFGMKRFNLMFVSSCTGRFYLQ